MRGAYRVAAGLTLAAGGAGLAYRARAGRKPRGGVVGRSVTVEKPPEEAYAFWRRLENLPRFMERVRSVEPIDDRRWHWVVSAPGGRTVEWDAELTDDRPHELISWRSLPGSAVDLSGRVEFRPAPGARGTAVRLTLEPRRAGALVPARLLERQVAEDLRRFKRLLETGEIATTEGQPSGKRSPLGKVLSARRERSAP